MMGTISLWWAERSAREQWLLGIMLALVGIVLAWLLIVRPVEAGLVDAKAEHQAAIDRNTAIRQRIAMLAALPPRPAPAQPVVLEQLVTDSAGETGFTIVQKPGAAPGIASVTIATARPTALFGWLSRLEGQGVMVDSVSVQPSGAGTVSAQVDLRKVAP